MVTTDTTFYFMDISKVVFVSIYRKVNLVAGAKPSDPRSNVA